MQGAGEGPDLFELVKMLVRRGKTGLLSVSSPEHRAEVWLDQGALVGAFYDDLSGPQALTRAILIGSVSWLFERHAGKFPRNITQATPFIIESIERILAECGDSLWGDQPSEALKRADDDDGLAPSEAGDAPETLRITAFAPPETGRQIGKCLLEEEIGRGASSVVYRARHRGLDSVVVVKVLMQGSDDQEEHRNLTRNEAQLLARLNHPHILRVFDFEDRGHYPHVVMEFVDGGCLGTLIKESGRVPVEAALPLLCQVTEALAHAHGQLGLVHCDIKPGNILLTGAMQAKVADFGLAKTTRMTDAQHAARAAVKGGVAGTPAYIAPEQVEGGWDLASHRSDIYSLGATFYHAVVGRPPFVDSDPLAQMAKRLREDPIPPHVVEPSIDRDFSDLIMSMLEREPNKRLHTWDDVLTRVFALAEARDEAEQRALGEKVIRRRTSFWTQVPARLFRRPSENGIQVG
jgi:tRNA A-37 threonylcarbamoyl transferase component Bud32